MLLDYAHPATRVVRLGAAAFTAVVGVFSGSFAVWCVLHASYPADLSAQAPQSFCGNCQQTINARLAASIGVPLEKTIPLVFFCGGCSLVLSIQSIRF